MHLLIKSVEIIRGIAVHIMGRLTFTFTWIKWRFYASGWVCTKCLPDSQYSNVKYSNVFTVHDGNS